MKENISHRQNKLRDTVKCGAMKLAFATLVRAIFDYLWLRNQGVVKDFIVQEEKFVKAKKSVGNKRFLLDYAHIGDINGLMHFFTSDYLDRLIILTGIEISPDYIRMSLNSENIDFGTSAEDLEQALEKVIK